MSILVLRNFKWIQNIDWLVSFEFFCLLNDLSVLGLKYVSHTCHANVQCTCMVLVTLTWLCVIWVVALSWWVVIAYSCQATKFWLPVAQKLICWNHSCKWEKCWLDPLKQATWWQGSGLSWDLSFYNPTCPEPVCIKVVP